ncbi:hypothetical protein ACHAW5_004901 [Stephanodiscus triporus]|uniref:Uncharacterized protein n=1 Tax=Stephanodiscus triporus TaxID=2934178 RepID=A0ABD3NZ28_9STRA
MRLIFLIAPISTCLGFAPSSSSPSSSSSRVVASTSLLAPALVVVPPSPLLPLPTSSYSSLPLSSRKNDDYDDDDEDPRRSRPRSSRLEGMQVQPTSSDIAIIDDMITKLGNAKPYELPNAVSRAMRVVSSPRFFLRIAERADMASDADEREKLAALAENLVNTIRAVVSVAEDGLNERAKDVERVVKAASEPTTGEFLVPLSYERVEAMRIEMEGLDLEDLNEGFLSTVDSWMNKAHQDGMDGMVVILQKALQIYAGTVISRARVRLQANVGAALVGEDQAAADALAAAAAAASATGGGERAAASALLEKLLRVDADSWNVEIRRGMEGENGVTKEALIGEVQKTMEGVILGLDNGSMAQRVQAEFLRELVTRIEAV